MKKYFLSLISILFLVSCSSVDFDCPMPKGIEPLKSVSSELIGNYYYSDSILNIEGKEKFYNSKYYPNAFTLNDSITLISVEIITLQKQITYVLNALNYYQISKVDTSRVIKKHEKATKIIIGNYICFKEKTTTDTLLNLNNKNDKLIYFNSKYYLNHFVEKNHWAIFQLEQKQNLDYSINLTNEEDYDNLIDSTKFPRAVLFKFSVVSLSNKKFKDFVAKGGFRAKFGLRKYSDNNK